MKTRHLHREADLTQAVTSDRACCRELQLLLQVLCPETTDTVARYRHSPVLAAAGPACQQAPTRAERYQARAQLGQPETSATELAHTTPGAAAAGTGQWEYPAHMKTGKHPPA